MERKAYERCGGLVKFSSQTKLNEAITEIVVDLKEDGFETEDIFDYIKQHVEEKLSEVRDY